MVFDHFIPNMVISYPALSFHTQTKYGMFYVAYVFSKVRT